MSNENISKRWINVVRILTYILTFPLWFSALIIDFICIFTTKENPNSYFRNTKSYFFQYIDEIEKYIKE